MKVPASTFFLVLFLFVGYSPAQKNAPNAQGKIEAEILKFFEEYGEDLRQHRKEAIAERYDRAGSWRMGAGRKVFTTFDEVKTLYTTKWTGPKSFAWRDLTVEVLSPDAAVVLGLFEWPNPAGEVRTYSYTGVLVKREGKWRIRVEDENGAPVRPPTIE